MAFPIHWPICVIYCKECTVVEISADYLPSLRELPNLVDRVMPFTGAVVSERGHYVSYSNLSISSRGRKSQLWQNKIIAHLREFYVPS